MITETIKVERCQGNMQIVTTSTSKDISKHSIYYQVLFFATNHKPIPILIRSILEPEILGNHNIHTGTALLLKTIVN